jgi:hypothetical protein
VDADRNGKWVREAAEAYAEKKRTVNSEQRTANSEQRTG